MRRSPSAGPAGSLAWWVGSTTGKFVGGQLDEHFDTSGKALSYAYGDTNSMTPAQADYMVQRVSNPITYTEDLVSATWHRFF